MKKVKPFECPMRCITLAAAHSIYRYRVKLVYNNAIKGAKWKRLNDKQFAYDRRCANE